MTIIWQTSNNTPFHGERAGANWDDDAHAWDSLTASWDDLESPEIALSENNDTQFQQSDNTGAFHEDNNTGWFDYQV